MHHQGETEDGEERGGETRELDRRQIGGNRWTGNCKRGDNGKTRREDRRGTRSAAQREFPTQ